MAFFTIKGKTATSPSLSVNPGSVVYVRSSVNGQFFIQLRIQGVESEVTIAYADPKERDEAFDALTKELAKEQASSDKAPAYDNRFAYDQQPGS
ncbi:hypothetical protein [Hymenobacter daeguensis]